MSMVGARLVSGIWEPQVAEGNARVSHCTVCGLICRGSLGRVLDLSPRPFLEFIPRQITEANTQGPPQGLANQPSDQVEHEPPSPAPSAETSGGAVSGVTPARTQGSSTLSRRSRRGWRGSSPNGCAQTTSTTSSRSSAASFAAWTMRTSTLSRPLACIAPVRPSVAENIELLGTLAGSKLLVGLSRSQQISIKSHP